MFLWILGGIVLVLAAGYTWERVRSRANGVDSDALRRNKHIAQGKGEYYDGHGF